MPWTIQIPNKVEYLGVHMYYRHNLCQVQITWGPKRDLVALVCMLEALKRLFLTTLQQKNILEIWN